MATRFLTFIKIVTLSVIFLSFSIGLPLAKETEERIQKDPNVQGKYEIPNYVLNITKDNTYPNPSQDLPMLQPSELTKELLDSSKVKIENPDLIFMLNETSIKKPFLAFGHHSTIYLGRWPLNYQSKETSVNWEYQKINTNFYDNRGGNAA